jgi:prepilin-type processing-associated H-X9-DG protein
VKCGSALRAIGQAIQMYANDHRGEFPRTHWTGPADPNPVPTFYTGADSPNAFAPGGPAANDVTAALFLVLKSQDLTREAFVCPTDYHARRLEGHVQQMSNFPGRRNLSYSYIVPYPSAKARLAGFKLDFSISSDFAIAADINPGGPALPTLAWDAPRSELWRGNSPNHDGTGQNVLYADGHVEFQTSSFCGMIRSLPGNVTFRDNVYYAGGPGTTSPAVVVAAPQDEKDSVLLPIAPEGPREPGVAERRATLLIAGAALVMMLGAVAVIRAMRKRGAYRRKSASAPSDEPMTP